MKVPVLSVIIGEGAAAAPWPWRQPAGCGCWKTPSIPCFPLKGRPALSTRMPARWWRPARRWCLSAQDMLNFGVVEGIIPEGDGFEAALPGVRDAFQEALDQYQGMTGEQIRQERYARFRRLGGDWA